LFEDEQQLMKRQDHTHSTMKETINDMRVQGMSLLPDTKPQIKNSKEDDMRGN
jgi:hypothetical protein